MPRLGLPTLTRNGTLKGKWFNRHWLLLKAVLRALPDFPGVVTASPILGQRDMPQLQLSCCNDRLFQLRDLKFMLARDAFMGFTCTFDAILQFRA
jgi:hypothetical protein